MTSSLPAERGPLLTRRSLLEGSAALLAGGVAVASFGLVIEPSLLLTVREYRLSLPGWGARPPLTLCVITDLHANEPWMPLDRIRRIVATANALQPDAHLLLGDIPGHFPWVRRRLPMPEVVEALAGLHAPLGKFAVPGNHEWWDDPEVQLTRRGVPALFGLLRGAGFTLLANGAVRLPHGDGVWLCGTDSMLAFRLGRRRFVGVDNLQAALAPLAADDAPAILMAHEPDQFVNVPRRVALTLSGHTHGGQVRILGWSPVVGSRYGNRFAYGLVEEAGRRLIVSGGLGCSVFPIRFGVAPELVLVRLS
ncbi:metallophosphoesterase [Roseomonas marmotae]|uniref:Metallophosphoesterase n=1 Tax=Roseomonas marmotae TaxID=2768161 RepID=A0ABS3KFJ6_9PROT|nr:metallophosphoesterase [Roseomonas marmotae]MBO1076244.1 metallophosphoesterase [Roseomonas marmotae]QTI77873.1 metallophosphoesterase [Roseomonas marmotae]